MVKRALRDRAVWEPLTKKPIVAERRRDRARTRARAARSCAPRGASPADDLAGSIDVSDERAVRLSDEARSRAREAAAVPRALDARGRRDGGGVRRCTSRSRGRTVDLGYKLGRARAEQARLREVKRVLSLEAASYETPQRVEMVARTLLGMTPPPPERVIAAARLRRRATPSDGARTSRDATEAAPTRPRRRRAAHAATEGAP